MKTLLYLETRLFINTLKNTITSPKRLIPMLIFAAWIIGNMLHLMLGMRSVNDPKFGAMASIPIESIQAVVFLFMILGSIGVLISAFSSSIMIFTIPYIDFLFPTPINRRDVLILKLLKDYIRYIFYICIFSSFFLPIILASLGFIGIKLFPSAFISILALSGLVILIVNIAHIITLIFTYGYGKLELIGTIIRTILITIPMVSVAMAVLSFFSGRDFTSSISLINRFPLMAIIFAPISWASQLFLSPLIGITMQGWIQLAIIWGLAAFSMIILVNRRESIYEPSIVPSIKAGRLRESRRSGDFASIKLDLLKEKGVRKAGYWGINPFGLGATALFWKNIQLQLRSMGSWSLSIILFPIVIAYGFKLLSFPNEVKYIFVGASLYATVLIGAIISRQLRLDLKYTDIIKPMPIAAWKVMLAQVLSSTAFIFIPIMLCGLSILVLIPPTRDVITYSTIFITPFLSYMVLTSSIVASVLYPDSKDFTQNFLLNLIGMLIVGFNVVLCVIVTGIVFVFFTHKNILASSIALSITCLGLGIGWTAIAGYAYNKFEPTGN